MCLSYTVQSVNWMCLCNDICNINIFNAVSVFGVSVFLYMHLTFYATRFNCIIIYLNSRNSLKGITDPCIRLIEKYKLVKVALVYFYCLKIFAFFIVISIVYLL